MSVTTTAFGRKPDTGQHGRTIKAMPIIGNALDMLQDPLGFCERVRRQAGTTAYIRLGPRNVLLVQGADGIRHILREHGRDYVKPDTGMRALEPLLGRSIATLTDLDEWEATRKFILPLFSMKMLKIYFKDAVASIGHEVEKLDSIAKSGATIDIYRFMHEATFRVLIRTIFRSGLQPDEVPELTSKFDAATAFINTRYATMNLPVGWAIPSARRGARALRQLDERVYRLIAERRAERRTESEDMLDALILAEREDDTELSDEEIRDNCMTMLFGGHETTAGSLTWAWGLLSRNPSVRQKMLVEVDSALADGNPREFSKLRELDYTDMVFSEAMRLYPMFGFLVREAGRDDVIEGIAVPKGTLILFSAYTVHRASELWLEPEKFQPERHNRTAKAERHKGAYLPFSQGQRACIGEHMARMEAVLMLAMISRHYLLELDGPLPPPKVRMSIKPDGGMPMRVVRRAYH
ncbi:MAG: cytochrome P450 [Pseudomonadota bacterium]